MDELISIVVDENAVEGRVRFLSINDIRVEILYPFGGVSKSRHIAYFGLPYFQYEHDGALTSHGRQTAEDLLKEIYEACVFCEANELELLLETRRFLEQSTYSLLVNAFSSCDFSGNWHLFPLFLLMFFLTDWEVVRLCQDNLTETFDRKLPEDLVRALVAEVR
jgi:hypothetical protein